MEQIRTALVVLRPGVDGPAAGAVRNWFAREGFVTGPLVGVSFAIDGPEQLFERVVGVDLIADAEISDLSPTAIDNDVAERIAALTVTAPPDFGPGNP